MPIDFTLTPEQQRLRADARAFARDVLLKVAPATQDLPTPLARFTATQPFYQQAVAAGFLRRLIPAPLGGQGTGVVDMAVLAEEFYAVDVNVSLTLFGTMLGLFRYCWAARRNKRNASLPRSHLGKAPRSPPSPSANPAVAPTLPHPHRLRACAPRRGWRTITG